jgi:hypothetical protein
MVTLHPRYGAYRPDQAGEIIGRVDGKDTGQRDGGFSVDAGDDCMRMITSAEDNMQSTGREAVIGKSALPGQEPRVFDSFDPRADMLRAK